MSTSEFDLDNPPPENEESPSARRRRERREGEKKEAKPTSVRAEGELVSRLNRAFGKIAEQLRIREDYELAEALEEDADAMSHGFVSLTSTFTPFRKPLVWFIGLVEPILAFWHVGGILLRRMFAMRERVDTITPEEYAAQQAQAEQYAARLG